MLNYCVTITRKQALERARSVLGSHTESCLDSKVLLAYTLNTSRTDLHTYPEKTLDNVQWQDFFALIKRRVVGIPIAYLVGQREFWSLPLVVSVDTLIPRPETELLVETALSSLGNLPNACILDLGTGCGAIALALARERPGWRIIACDISATALSVARYNARCLKIQNVDFLVSDWFENIPKMLLFNGIIANPPYISMSDPYLKEGDVRFEPKLALIGGCDGLQALRHIIKYSLNKLQLDGILLVEHGYAQKNHVRSIFNYYGYNQV